MISGSPAVDIERLLEAEGNRGAEKVLDAADMYDSCESGSSRGYKEGMGAVIAVFGSSVAMAMRESRPSVAKRAMAHFVVG